jgi:hypothetical protein
MKSPPVSSNKKLYKLVQDSEMFTIYLIFYRSKNLKMFTKYCLFKGYLCIFCDISPYQMEHLNGGMLGVDGH